MFPWGSKYLFGASALSLLSAWFYGIATGGGLIGVLSFGYKGGVGDHFGYTVLMGLMLVCFMLACVVFATRDGDALAMAQLAGTEVTPQVTPATRPAYYGPLTAFATAAGVLGLAVSKAFLYLGIATLFLIILLWTVEAWSDRVSADNELNQSIRNRTLGPLEVPMIAAIGIAGIVLAMSRMFLATSKVGSVVIGSIFSLIIFVGAVMLSRVDNVSRKTWTAILAVGAVAILGGGVIGAAMGERDFHHVEAPGEDDHGGEGE